MSREHTQTIEWEQPHPPKPSAGDFLTPDVSMMILTWVTFFLLLAVLYKFTWRPILSALEAREEKIRKALDDAHKAREELEKIEQGRQARIAEADHQAREIVERARKAAIEAAHVIEHKARDDVQIRLTNADHEIQAQAEKVRLKLREESVNTALELARKILQEELDETKHKKLTDRFIKNFRPDAS